MTPRRRWFAKARRRPRMPGEMNGLERAYADHLNLKKAAGEIVSWWFEQYTFKLADDTRYTPDFAVLTSDYELEFHETKGVWKDDARVKIKVAASLFPHRFVGVQREGRKGAYSWAFEEFSHDPA